MNLGYPNLRPHQLVEPVLQVKLRCPGLGRFQFDGNVFIVVKILTQTELSEITRPNFLPNAAICERGATGEWGMRAVRTWYSEKRPAIGRKQGDRQSARGVALLPRGNACRTLFCA